MGTPLIGVDVIAWCDDNHMGDDGSPPKFYRGIVIDHYHTSAGIQTWVVSADGCSSRFPFHKVFPVTGTVEDWLLTVDEGDQDDNK